jgi:hypothetical protein
MKKKFLFGLLAAVLVLGGIVAGCDTGGGGDDDSDTRVFSVSGSFTKSAAAGGGLVNFELQGDAAALFAGRSAGRAVTADSYTVSGVLEDGDLTIRLKGSYDPDTGGWSASAKSSLIIYTLSGKKGVAGSSSATIAVNNNGNWESYFIPVTEQGVSIAGVAVEGETGGMPAVFHGYWNINWTDPSDGSVDSISSLVSEWNTKASGTHTNPRGEINSIDQDQTVISVTNNGDGSYTYICCYPKFEVAENPSATPLIKAITEYMGISENDIAVLEWPLNENNEWTGNGGHPPFEGRWVTFKDASDPFGNGNMLGGFSETELAKLTEFLNTNGWKKWVAAHPEEAGGTMVTKYVKAKMSGNGSTFTMTPMTTPEKVQDFHGMGEAEFDSLAELDGATVEATVGAMTLNR